MSIKILTVSLISLYILEVWYHIIMDIRVLFLLISFIEVLFGTLALFHLMLKTNINKNSSFPICFPLRHYLTQWMWRLTIQTLYATRQLPL